MVCTEDQMLRQLTRYVRTVLEKSRLPNPNYKECGIYHPQWKCLCGVYYYQLPGIEGKIIATRKTDQMSRTTECRFNADGIDVSTAGEHRAKEDGSPIYVMVVKIKDV